MKGSYKVYNANKGEWVNLDTSAGYDNVKVKIENNKLYVSYDYGTENSWEYVGDVGGNVDISGKVDKTYVDSNFAKNTTVSDLREEITNSINELIYKDGDFTRIECFGGGESEYDTSHMSEIACAPNQIYLSATESVSTGTLTVKPHELSFGNFKIQQKAYNYTIYFPGNDSFGSFVGNYEYWDEENSKYIFEGYYSHYGDDPEEHGDDASIRIPDDIEFLDKDSYVCSGDYDIIVKCDGEERYLNLAGVDEGEYPVITRSVPYSLRPRGSVGYINGVRILTTSDLPENIVTETGSKRIIIGDSTTRAEIESSWEFKVENGEINFTSTDGGGNDMRVHISANLITLECSGTVFTIDPTEGTAYINGAEIITTDNLIDKIAELS